MCYAPELCINCGSTLILTEEKFVEGEEFEVDETYKCYCGAKIRFRAKAPNIEA